MVNSRASGHSFIMCYFTNSSTTSPLYNSINNTSFTGTEGDVDTIINRAFTIKRLTVTVWTMTKASETTIGFRDDGATVTSIAVTASTPGTYDSGLLNIKVASGSLVNWLMSGNTGAGAIVGTIILEIKTT